MTRVIAGVAGGRPLVAPKGRTTRPTSDRVKEAIFASLSADPGLAGRSVLDLYAGSGGLGLEAASRRATRVVLVEQDRQALLALRSNVSTLGIEGVDVVSDKVERFLAKPDGSDFDIVLIDPPYSLDVGPVLQQLVDGRWLGESATVVVERATRDAVIAWPGVLEPLRERSYGDTTVCFARHRPAAG
jgi:16S rRNA (guanine966-N2)-methyltransferase